jgi:hypothetical protein
MGSVQGGRNRPGVHNPEPITIDVKNIYITLKLKMLAVDALVLEEIETRYNLSSIVVLVTIWTRTSAHRHESSA